MGIRATGDEAGRLHRHGIAFLRLMDGKEVRLSCLGSEYRSFSLAARNVVHFQFRLHVFLSILNILLQSGLS